MPERSSTRSNALDLIEEFVARGLAGQRAVDTILHQHNHQGGPSMPRPKAPRKNTKPFGGYQISFAGREESAEKIFGPEALTPSEMTKRLWSYIKRNRLAAR